MKPYSNPAVFALIAMLAVAGCNSGQFGASVDTSTPEAAFASIKDAAKNENWDQFCSLMTQESRNQMAGAMIAVGPMVKMRAAQNAPGDGADQGEDDKFKQASKEVDRIFNEYNVQLSSDSQSALSFPSQQDIQKILSKIDDVDGFLAEMIGVMESVTEEGQASPTSFANAEMQELKIDGNSATASVITGGQAKPISFRKGDGGWRVHLTEKSKSQ